MEKKKKKADKKKKKTDKKKKNRQTNKEQTFERDLCLLIYNHKKKIGDIFLSGQN